MVGDLEISVGGGWSGAEWGLFGGDRLEVSIFFITFPFFLCIFVHNVFEHFFLVLAITKNKYQPYFSLAVQLNLS